MAETPTIKGNNLLSLFGLDKSGSILIMGKRLSLWKEIFPQANYCPLIHNINNKTVNYDLVLLNGSEAKSVNELQYTLFLLKRCMSQHGVIILLVKNWSSFERIKSLIKTGTLTRGELLYRYNQIMKIAARASFPSFQIYLPFSEDMELIDEMVTPGSLFIEIPHYYHPIKRLAQSIDKYHMVHDRFSVIFMQRGILQHDLFDRIKTTLSEYEKIEGIRLHVERFDIRDRGALAVFVKEENLSKYFIIRIVHGFKTKAIIKKNHEFLTWLHNMKDLPDEVKKKIPIPLDEFSFKESHVFLETFIPGQLAWKANKRKIRNRIFNDSIQFIFSLNTINKQLKYMDQKEITSLFSNDIHLIEKSEVCSFNLKKLFRNKVEYIKHNIAGLHMCLAAYHGDYGYGNIMVDPRDGRLQGVIDWDTGRKQDFAGVDLMNLMIEKERTERDIDFFRSVQHLLGKPSLGIPTYVSDYLRTHFDLDGIKIRLVFFIAIIRNISRAAQYPDIFLAEKDGYTKALEIIRENYQHVH